MRAPAAVVGFLLLTCLGVAQGQFWTEMLQRVSQGDLRDLEKLTGKLDDLFNKPKPAEKQPEVIYVEKPAPAVAPPPVVQQPPPPQVYQQPLPPPPPQQPIIIEKPVYYPVYVQQPQPQRQPYKYQQKYPC